MVDLLQRGNTVQQSMIRRFQGKVVGTAVIIIYLITVKQGILETIIKKNSTDNALPVLVCRVSGRFVFVIFVLVAFVLSVPILRPHRHLPNRLFHLID